MKLPELIDKASALVQGLHNCLILAHPPSACDLLRELSDPEKLDYLRRFGDGNVYCCYCSAELDEQGKIVHEDDDRDVKHVNSCPIRRARLLLEALRRG